MTDIETIIGLAVCGGFILVIILMKNEITDLIDGAKTSRRRKNLRYVPKVKHGKEGVIEMKTEARHLTKSTDDGKAKYHPQSKSHPKVEKQEYKRTTVWLQKSTTEGLEEYLNNQCALRSKEGKREVEVYLDEAVSELIELYRLNAAIIGNASAKILCEEMQKMVDANKDGVGKP